LLILSFRERVLTFVLVNVGATAVIAIFLASYFSEVRRNLFMRPIESYFNVSFASKNLPFGLVPTVEQVSGWSLPSPASIYIGYGICAVLLLGCIAISQWILKHTTLSSTLPLLHESEQIFLVIGAVLITGCFFMGQNVGYRGVFLLLTLPGLLAVRSLADDRRTSRLALSTALLIVFVIVGRVLSHQPGARALGCRHTRTNGSADGPRLLARPRMRVVVDCQHVRGGALSVCLGIRGGRAAWRRVKGSVPHG
jgi:hypothetical protein